jgi:AcrR family transcriptional regulator
MKISHAAQPAPPHGALRERILGAAFDAFMEGGYGGTSTLDIARRAKVSKRDLYAQFGSKQAMLAACIESRSERMRMPLYLPVPRSRAGLEATLVAFGTQLLLEVSRPEVLATYRLAIAEAERAPELARMLDELGRAGNQIALIELLAAALREKLLYAAEPNDIAAAFLALLWSGGLLPQLLLRLVPPPDETQRLQRARRATEQTMRLYGSSPVKRTRAA